MALKASDILSEYKDSWHSSYSPAVSYTSKLTTYRYGHGSLSTLYISIQNSVTGYQSVYNLCNKYPKHRVPHVKVSKEEAIETLLVFNIYSKSELLDKIREVW